MSVHLEIPFETLSELVKQLSPEEKRHLLKEIRADVNDEPLTPEEKIHILQGAVSSVPVIRDFPIRREDMYDDDGR
jgi:hypothetical protein